MLMILALALAVQANATLFVRHHRLSDEPDDLFRHLYQLCTYHLEVRGLASGRSGAVSGEVRHFPLRYYRSFPTRC